MCPGSQSWVSLRAEAAGMHMSRSDCSPPPLVAAALSVWHAGNAQGILAGLGWQGGSSWANPQKATEAQRGAVTA